MELILLIMGALLIAFCIKIGTLVRFSFHYVCKSNKLKGINVINIDGSNVRFLMILGALTVLPKNVLELIKKKETIIFYGKNPQHFADGDFAGLFHSEENYIFVLDDGLFGNWGWQVTTILHEVGHFVDYSIGYNNFSSCGDVVLHNIYGGEHKYYERHSNGSYFQNNIREYFAQSFAEYFLVAGFKQECPDTYLYIEDMFETI